MCVSLQSWLAMLLKPHVWMFKHDIPQKAQAELVGAGTTESPEVEKMKPNQSTKVDF